MTKHEDVAQDKPLMKKIAKAEVKSHEKKMHGAKKMAKGGPTSEDRMRLGRGLSRAANQKTG